MSEILTQDLGMKHVTAKFVPWLFLPEQKEHRAASANDLIQTATNEPDFLKKIVTLKGAEASLSYVQCFLYFASCTLFFVSCFFVTSSINVSIFLSTWLITFWTDLVCLVL